MENLDGNNKNVSLNLIAEYGGSDSESDDTETHTTCDNSESVELSEMVLKNNIINACAHGPLSRSNVSEEAETTRHMIIDNAESGVVEYEVTEYRDVDSDSDDSSSSDSSSEVDSVKDVEEIESGDENEGGKPGKPVPPKVHGELALDELPPIEDLAISWPAQDTTKIGTVASIVERLVVVRAYPGTAAVDLDTVLFLDNGAKTLGKVFDVFGSVTEPHYCVRFNSSEHVAARGVAPGLEVCVAARSRHTNYVFLTELIKIKGSDASWLNDIEPPPSHIEYSDDEEERRAKAEHKQSRQEDGDGETSKSVRKQRNQRPSESSSRFGSGPSRGRNPFSMGSRRNNPNTFPRFARPWGVDMRTPPAHPGDANAPTFPPGPPMFPPPFMPYTPPFLGNMNSFQFGGRVPGPMVPSMMPPPFRQNVPMFGNFSPHWMNSPPPPPGT